MKKIFTLIFILACMSAWGQNKEQKETIAAAVELAQKLIPKTDRELIDEAYERMFKQGEKDIASFIEIANIFKEKGDLEAYERQMLFIEDYKNSMEKSKREKEGWDKLLNNRREITQYLDFLK